MVSPNLLECNQIEVIRGVGAKRQMVLNQLSLTLETEHILALVGPNGVGKSTLLKTLAGLLSPSQGGLIWKGQSVQALPKSQVGAVLENASAYGWMYPMEYLTFFAELYGVSQLQLEEVVNLIALPLPNKPIHQLSKGNQTVLHLIRSVLHLPKLILWDEVFNHLDPERQIHIENFIRTYCREKQASCILSTHHLSRLPAFVDKILFLNQGSKVWEGTREQLTHELKKMGYQFTVTQKISETDFEGLVQKFLIPVNYQSLVLENTLPHGMHYILYTSQNITLQDWQEALQYQGNQLQAFFPIHQSLEEWYQQRVQHG